MLDVMIEYLRYLADFVWYCPKIGFVHQVDTQEYNPIGTKIPESIQVAGLKSVWSAGRMTVGSTVGSTIHFSVRHLGRGLFPILQYVSQSEDIDGIFGVFGRKFAGISMTWMLSWTFFYSKT